jgi:glycosyltransferase involved in cell wall biosynthesis
MKIGCVCPTYKRPKLLGRAIHCFLRQSWKDSYLVVLDDAGQYQPQTHQRWRLVSAPERYNSLGGKRLAGVQMLPDDCEGYLCWDDDDVYWPHAVEAVATALETHAWAQCRLVYETAGDNALAVTHALSVDPSGRNPRFWGYGGCWAYRLKEFWDVGGYDDDAVRSCNDDLDLANKFLARYGPSGDSTASYWPWYWYNRDPGVNKVCDEGQSFWQTRGQFPFTKMKKPPIGWNGDNLYNRVVLEGIHGRPF